MAIFEYGETEIAHLKRVDATLGKAIEEIGHIKRPVIPDLFASLVSSIVSQQISSKAAATIWNRMLNKLGKVTPQTINAADVEQIQQCGMSMRKAGYIKEIAEKVLCGDLNIELLHQLPDDEVCKQLSSLSGIGIWTAEMLMTFSMQRPNVISWGDMAIHRGLRMLYRHRKIDKTLFQKYKRRYSPYATVASLYLWAIAGGACGLKDCAPLTEAQKAKARKGKAMEKKPVVKQAKDISRNKKSPSLL
ncbi:MAG: DNA-3-methyladenine glycosylase 2 family protein [Bacteroidales bacterium]|jgi:DNA-3-methyladenine glycosylase II|nr:DNA-3-methyladenine glycosylase 2 family protein [Bacteroidales bacterium]